ncbi:MAG: polyprenyl synthetase family protein, partial [Dokdonella sp.]
YLDVIERKTAVLFAAATQLGGVLARLPAAQEEALADYGLALGFAFQIADDVLDYVSDAGTLGKNIGDDLAEGKPTLPIIVAIARSEPAQAARLKAAIQAGGLDALEEVLAAIHLTGALDASRKRARAYAERAQDALGTLPPSDAREALAALAEYAVDRTR